MPQQEIEVTDPAEVPVLRRDMEQIQEPIVRMGLHPTEIAEPIEVVTLRVVRLDTVQVEVLEVTKVEQLLEALIVGQAVQREAVGPIEVPVAEAQGVLEVSEVPVAEAQEALEALEVLEEDVPQ